MPNSAGSPSLNDLFADPPAAFRGKPFWSWNGRIEKEELLRQVRVFKEMGMGGFFMHSRTGLKTEYLGSEWFECINACADEAARLGLEAWLYDEDRWPSGSAGGLATKEPAYRMKVLRLSVHQAGGFEWPAAGAFVAAFTAQLDGLAFTSSARLAYGAMPPQDGRSILLFTVESWSGQSFYNGNTYLDTLSAAATARFIEITHERYRANCGERLGQAIRGIFTDEPHHGTVMCENNENRSMADQRWTTPWTESLWDEFQGAWGYDLRERLPELFLFPEGRRVSPVKWHYMELLQRMFLENWARPVQEWCKKNELLLTGHVLHEDSLAGQAVPCGSAMRYYEYLDVPGVDVLALHNRNYWIVKQAASAARQFGRKWVLSELYGCTGWQLDFAGHKRIGAWQALLGVNVRCHHLAWMTMEGEAKRDYPASIHFQSAWHREYAAVEDYFARFSLLLQQGVPICDVLVINPVESAWAQIHPGWAQWLGALDAGIEELERTYRDVFHWLVSAQLDFDYGDEDHLARFGKIESDGEGPVLRLGDQCYRVAVVAGMVTIRKSVLRLLSEFVEAGGAVIFAGTPPEFVEALPSEAAWKLAARAVDTPLEESALVAAVRQASRFPLRLVTDPPAANRDLLCQVRRDGDTWIVAVVNTSEEQSCQITLRLAAPGQVEEWDCQSGNRSTIPASSAGGSLAWSAALPPLGERIFVVGPSGAPAPPHCAEFHPGVSVELRGPFAYSLDEPNLCVLDFAEGRMGGGDWLPRMEILQLNETIRDMLGMEQRSGVMVQPWASAKRPPSSAAPVPLELRFRFDVRVLPESPVSLLIENPSAYRIAVNGQPMIPGQDGGWLIDPCFKRCLLPPGALRPGANEIVLSTGFTPETEIETIYLLGDFGVALDAALPALARLPRFLLPSDVTAQGLPFYSGRITYRLPLPGWEANRPETRLHLGKFGGAVARVRTGEGGAGSLIAWPPYETDITALPRSAGELLCDVWLTRRNTFGPLHLLPREQPHIGPASFRSKGGEFTSGYVLYPSGLLEAPWVVEGERVRG